MARHGSAAQSFKVGARLLHSFSHRGPEVVCEVRLIGEFYSRIETADKDRVIQSDWLANEVIGLRCAMEMKSNG